MARSLRDSFTGRSSSERPERRAAAAAVAALVVCALGGAIIAIFFAGGGGTPDNTIGMVPEDAYVYAHADLDPDSDQVEQALSLASRFPHFDAISQGIFGAVTDSRLDLRGDVLSWAGDEAAAALVPAPGGAPQPLLLVAIRDQAGARSFARRTVSGARSLTTAERNGFLLVGSKAAVGAAMDVADGKAGSLAGDGAASEVRESLPSERLVDVYVSEEGIGRLLAGRPGAAQLDTFTDFGASRGFAAAIVAQEDGLEVQLSSSLDPEQAQAEPPFFSAFPPFDPTLAETLSPDTLAMLSIGDPSKTTHLLLDQADAAVPGISAAFDRLDRSLQQQGNVGITRDVLPLLDDQAAVALAAGTPLPHVTLVFDGVDEEKASDAVAGLLVPLIREVNPASTGQAPSLSEEHVGDVAVHTVRLTPAVDLSYAVSGERLVVSTDPKGVEQAVSGSASLATQHAYRVVTAGASGGVSALLFLNLKGLVRLARPLGLAEIVAGFDPDLAQLEALGLTVRSESDSLDTRIFLEIGKPQGES